MKHWPFTVVSDGGKPKMEVEYKGERKTFFPEEVSSMVLTKMKEISEAYLGKVGSLTNQMKKHLNSKSTLSPYPLHAPHVGLKRLDGYILYVNNSN